MAGARGGGAVAVGLGDTGEVVSCQSLLYHYLNFYLVSNETCLQILFVHTPLLTSSFFYSYDL